MKKLLLLFLPLILISCPKEDDQNGDVGEIMTEAEIGPSGGILETAKITLTVPPGTFTATHSVQIAIEQVHTDDFGGSTVTQVYRVSGIPAVTSGPMTVRIQYDGTLEDESYIALGNVNEMLEDGEEEAIYALYPATESSGYLVAEIPLLPGDVGDAKKAGNAGGAEGLKSAMFHPCLYMVFSGVSHMTHNEGAYFNFSYPSRMDEQKVLQLAAYLHEALDAYFELNLASQETMDAVVGLMGRPTVVVTGKTNTGPGAFSVEMPRMARLNKDNEMANLERYSMNTNVRLNITMAALEQSAPEELKAIAYVWVYRMIYFFYFGDYMDWYAYASAIYMKEKFAGVSDYSPAQFSQFGKSPFEGMEAGRELYDYVVLFPSRIGGRISNEVRSHAMGMYPFIKYLDQRYPGDKELYLNIMRETIQSESGKSMEGIIQALEDPEYEWWPEFFRQYLTRQLADIPAEDFLKFLEADNEINFDQEANLVKYNNGDYADLSARLYRINFLFPDFQNESSLNLKTVSSDLSQDYLTAMAFGLKNNALEYFDRAPDLTVEGLKTLKENGTASIVVAVVNSASEPATDERLNIELQSRLRSLSGDFAFSKVKISLSCWTNYTYSAGGTSEGRFDYTPSESRPGVMMGDVFTATWDEATGSASAAGTIEVEFDPDQYPFHVTRLSVEAENGGTPWMNPATEEWLVVNESFSITGEHLELEEYDVVNSSGFRQHYFTLRVYDTDACNYLTGVNHVVRDRDMNLIREGDGSYVCDAQSDFWITMYCADHGTSVAR